MFTRRDLVRLIIPLIIEQVLAATVGIADTFMVSSVGEAAVSGVSLVDSINLLLLNVFAALSTGGSIVASQYLGREDQPSANAAAKQLLTVTTLVSFGLVAVCMPGSKFILHALFGSADAAVMGNAEVYFLLSALSYPFMAVYNACAALFRAQGNSKISMMAALVMNIVNISFNALFIYGLRLGAAGAALGSLIARGVSAAFLLAVLCHHNNRIYLDELKKLEWHPAMIKSILRIGVPNGLENSMFHIGKLMVAGLITTFGTVAIAANAVGNSVMTMSQMPGAAVSLAMVTVVGQCVGAGEFPQAKKYMLGLVGAGARDEPAAQPDPDFCAAPDHRAVRAFGGDGGGGLADLPRLRARQHPLLADVLRPAERPARRQRREVHDDHVGRIDVGVPGDLQLYPRPLSRAGAARGVGRDDHRLGLPRGHVYAACCAADG